MIVVAACSSARPLRDGGADAAPDGDADAPRDADEDLDADDEPSDPQCLSGQDPDGPALRFVELSAYRPLALHGGGGFVGQIFDDVLASSPILLVFESLDDEAEATLAVGSGRSEGEVYEFDGTLDPPARARVRLDGLGFESEPADVTCRGQPSGVGRPVDLHLRDTVVSGEFTTPERCSVGALVDADVWRAGGGLLARLTVSDARETTIQYITAEITLCQVLSGLLEFHPGTSCDEMDAWAWPYQPDATVRTASGDEPAWTFDADFAATAIRLADHE